MKKLLMLVLIGLFFNLAIKAEDEPCKRPDKKTSSQNAGGDFPDDNYSYSSGFEEKYFLISPDILIFNSGSFSFYLGEKILKNKKAITDLMAIPDTLLDSGRVIIFPSASLFGINNVSILKVIIEEYVRKGGTILIFDQQYGSHIDNVVPIPQGAALKSYGFREDQSCFNGSLYFKDRHPVLSSLTNEKVNGTVDGYFSAYPSNSTVLLRRTSNLEPALLYYPYGQGTVILTSLYTDYANAHSQASSEELRLVRDLITFARNPNLPIPMYDVAASPNPAINLIVRVKNNSEGDAAKVKIVVKTADWKTVLFSLDPAISIGKNGEVEVPVSFTLPAIATAQYGICHTEYELYDADGNLIQPASEADSGRFALYGTVTPLPIGSGFYQWLTVEKDEVFWNENIHFTLHLKNETDQTRKLDADSPFMLLNHFSMEIPVSAIHVSLAPGESVEREIMVPANNIYKEGITSCTFRLQYYDGPTLKQIGRAKGGIVIMGPDTVSKIVIKTSNNILVVKSNSTLEYSFQTTDKNGSAGGITHFKLVLEKQLQANQPIYNEIETVYEADYDFASGNPYIHAGSYLSSLANLMGSFRLKLTVTRPDCNKEVVYKNFSYIQSIVQAEFEPETIPRLIPGGTYHCTLSITNMSPFGISGGKCKIFFKSISGQYAGTKEVDGIAIASGEKKQVSETLVFQPSVSGGYFFSAAFEDESGRKLNASGKYYDCVTSCQLKADKLVYAIGEVVHVNAELMGVGIFRVKATCVDEAYEQERMVELSGSNGYKAVELFDVPLGMSGIGKNTSYVVLVIKNEDSFCSGNQANALCQIQNGVCFHRPEMSMDCSSIISPLNPKVGVILNAQLKVKNIFGIAIPFGAEWKIKSQGLSFDETKSITLNPVIEQVFENQLAIPQTVTPGNYDMAIEFWIGGLLYYSKVYKIIIAQPTMNFSEPPSPVEAGGTLDLSCSNSGGKDGEFEATATLRDELGTKVAEQSATLTVPAGGTQTFVLNVPASLKSGRYILTQQARETQTGRTFYKPAQVQVNGLSATLAARTEKEKYVAGEMVDGHAQIVSGNGAISNGSLLAEVYKGIVQGGVKYQAPGQFASYNAIWDGEEHDGQLYLATDVGLVRYDPISKEIALLLEKAELQSVCLDGGDEIWVAAADGVYRRNALGDWRHYTTTDGLPVDYVSQVVEQPGQAVKTIWTATYAGTAVFRDNAWTTYATANGLPSNTVYKLAVDGQNRVWLSTNKGVVRWNGTTFEGVAAPFGNTSIGCNLCGSVDGSIWCADIPGTDSEKIYRFADGTWQQWNVAGIHEGMVVAGMDSSGGAVWFLGYMDTIREIVSYLDGAFRVHEGSSAPLVNSIIGVVRSTGAGAFLSCDLGLARYDAGVFSRNFIPKDESLLPGEPLCLERDQDGNLLCGTIFGLSSCDGSSWQNRFEDGSGGLLGQVKEIAAAPDGTIYTLTDRNIVYFSGTQKGQIAFNEEMCPQYDEMHIAIDAQNRLWLAGEAFLGNEGTSDFLAYYRDGWQYVWDRFEPAYCRSLKNDGSGGLWLGLIFQGNSTRLLHVASDLSIQEYTPENSGVLARNLNKMFVAADGKLWLVYNARGVDGDIDEEAALQSFDGMTWQSYMTYPGYPEQGVVAVAQHEDGAMVFLGVFNDLYNGIFRLEGDRFTDSGVRFHLAYGIFDLVSCHGKLYCPGKVNEEQFQNGLLEIGGAAGVTSEQVWQGTWPVELAAGATQQVDLATIGTLAAGTYTLRAKVLNDVRQSLAQSEYAFTVAAASVGTSLISPAVTTPFIKPGTAVSLSGEVKNYSAEPMNDISYLVKTISPTGVESELHSATFSLAAGQAYERNLELNESETGVWRVQAEAKQGETLLSSAELLLQVCAPQVSAEYIHPEYAGDEPFAVKVRLSNDGRIASNIHVSVGAQDVVPLIDEDISLLPGEERLLTAQDTIAIDKTYDVQLSGDVNVSEQFSVNYGYQENFTVAVQPQCREGAILVGYTMENSGGLPFADTAHFELYAAGNATPLYELEKTYNLYPGVEAINDSVSFVLGPGVYELRCHTGRVAQSVHPIQVLPAGLALLSDYAVSAHYPPGLNDFTFALTNTDSVAGNIPLTMEIKDGAGATVFNETRTYFLQAAEKKTDSFSFAFSQAGNYTVSWSGVKLEQPVAAVFQVLPLVDVAATAEILPVANGSAPVRVNVQNNGFLDFAGSVRIEASGLSHEETLAVTAADALSGVFALDCNGLVSGTQELKAYVLDGAGAIIAQAAQNITIHGADIQVVAVPQNLEIAAGSYAEARLRLKNEGDLRGEAKLRINAFDTLSEERAVVLEAGEEQELSGLFIDADGDMPAGNYTCAWVLSGSGVSGGNGQGAFPFTVSGVQVQVSAQLDKDIYAVGDTANLNLQISAPGPVTAPLEAVCNWGDFLQRQPIDLTSGHVAIDFNIPVAEERQDKVFYGIYFSDGRGLYLNDLYLCLSGLLSVTLDRQVYSPGQTVHATFHSTDAGILTAESFGQSYSQAISGSLALDFPLPAGTLGGSYGVTWEFVPNDTGQAGNSGVARFDVSGLVIKVARAELEKGKYAPGETVRANLLLESNSDETLQLRSWIARPSGEWDFIEEKDVTVAADRQVAASITGIFNTTEAGTHQLVYGLYKGKTLVTSGANAFDCGDAVLLGVATDHLEYPQGNESVLANWDGFGSGQAALEIFLDNSKVEERAVALSGLSKGQVAIDSAYVSGGGHSLKAVLRQGSLASERDAQFVYGSQLGDLSMALTERKQDGWAYSYKVRVSNNGKKATSGTVLVFSVDGQDEAAATIAQLQPGESQELDFSWSGVQRAGSHILRFDVDSGDAVKEFDETNNRLQLNEEVLELELVMESEPKLWQANTEVTLFSRLFNNRAAAGTFKLQLTVTGLQSSQIMFQREKTVTISPFAQTAESDLFSTGMYPAGEYEIKQTLSGEDLQLQRELIVTLAASKQIAAELQVTPAVITAEKDSMLTLHIDCQNIGNVNLSGEELDISVERKQTGETVASEQILLDLDMGQEKSWESVLTVNVSPGEYQVLLKLAGKTVASAEFAALSGTVVEKSITFAPRVLFLNTLAAPWNWCKVWFSNVLQAAKVFCEDSNKIADGYGKYQKGENNIIVVFGNLTNMNLKKEIVERVYRGEGAILVLGSAVNLAGWEELAGVKAKIVPAALAESELEIAASEFSPGGFLRLKNSAKMELLKKDATTQILGWSKVSKKIMLARHNFGLGQVLTIAFKPDLVSGSELLEKLLLQAVRLFARDVYSISEISRILPVGITVHNNEEHSRDFVVKESIPFELKAFGFSPQPEKPEAPEWKFSVAANGKKEIGYWLELPNQVKAWDLTSEVSVAGEVIGKPVLSLEVKDTHAERIDWVLEQLGMLQVPSQDKAKINYVRQNLLKMRKRKGDSAAIWNQSLTDAIRAAGKLAEIKSKELSTLRNEVQNLMIYCGRRFYEASVHFRSEEIQQIMDSQANEADQAEEPQIEN